MGQFEERMGHYGPCLEEAEGLFRGTVLALLGRVNPASSGLGPRCRCEDRGHAPKLVVLTGGPGAGKTAVLEVARKSFCEHILVLPEAASIVFGGGFWRRKSSPGVEAAQRAIFHVQREQERMVLEEKRAAVVLCDRGTLDGLAYWPDSEAAYWAQVGTSRAEELSRYATIIHLRTPKLEHGYNLSNPVRVESAMEASQIDERILRAWEGHPRVFVVDSSADFLKKALRVLSLIQAELPVCCRSHEIVGLGRKEGP